MNVSFYNARSFSKPNGIFWAFSLKETQIRAALYGMDGATVFHVYRNRSSLEKNRYYYMLIFTFIRLQVDAD